MRARACRVVRAWMLTCYASQFAGVPSADSSVHGFEVHDHHGRDMQRDDKQVPRAQRRRGSDHVGSSIRSDPIEKRPPRETTVRWEMRE